MDSDDWFDNSKSLHLSNAAHKSLNTKKLSDALGSAIPTMRGVSAAKETLLTESDRERLRTAIKVAKEEFLVTLSAMKRVMWAVLTGIIIAIGLAIIGGTLLQVSPYASIISISSIGALIPLLIKAWKLARDQCLLELIPARYALAAEFCRTTDDAQKLIKQFLKETSTPK